VARTCRVNAGIRELASAAGRNLSRTDQAALGVLPAHQRLGADRATGQHACGLVVDDDLVGVGGQRLPEFGDQLETRSTGTTSSVT